MISDAPARSRASAPTTTTLAPSPYFFYHLVNGNYAAYTNWEFWCVFFLTPLPFILNSYWFYLLFTGVIKFHNKKNLTPAQREKSRNAQQH